MGESIPKYLYATTPVNDGIFDKIFEASVMKLFQEKLVDCTILHGDGTNHAAKKGGDNFGFNAYKRIKGDKVVVVCDRNVNVIAPFNRGS